MKLAVCAALVLVATLALGSPLDDSHRAALFRRTRIGPKVYKHEDQSRPGIPVADNQDTPAASGEVSARAAKPPAKELPASVPAASDESSAPSAPVAPGKPGLNRLFARKKYSPLLRSDGSLKGAASESATTVPSSTEAAVDSSDGPGSSVATSTRRTRPTRPGKVPRVTSPKPTVSVKPTKISSRFSKPTPEPTDSTVTPVTQRTTRGRRTRPSKPPKGGPVPVTEATTTTSTAPSTTSTTSTTTAAPTTPVPTTPSSTTTTTTTVGPTTSTSTVADPGVLVEGTSVVHSSVRGETSSSSASPTTTVTPSTTTTTAAPPPPPGDADDDEVPAPITTNGQQQPSEPVARPDRDRDDETLVFSRAPSGPKADRVIPVVERQDDASAEDDSGPLRATSFERADDRK
ncbi:integumentary mucin C.1-like [Anopheles bellator]|uniref:integumentary mucin C.1-like n=1 Tax=Anopheles bellator TaxID=139047 RepID=UPI00264768E2|nr:integumentary mucin C.1-like [Anopheles bellator]